jgi:hypothetical protein
MDAMGVLAKLHRRVGPRRVVPLSQVHRIDTRPVRGSSFTRTRRRGDVEGQDSATDMVALLADTWHGCSISKRPVSARSVPTSSPPSRPP